MRVNIRVVAASIPREFSERNGENRSVHGVIARRHAFVQAFFFLRSSRSSTIDRTTCHSCGLLRGRNCKTVTRITRNDADTSRDCTVSGYVYTTIGETIKCHPIRSPRWMTSGSFRSSRMQRAFYRRRPRLPTTLPRISQS